MESTNRTFIVLCAFAWIAAMGVIIALTWAAPDRTIDRIGDFAEFLGNNNTDAGKIVITLAALAAGILALLIVVVVLAPDDDPKELRIEQAGATMIVPSDALRMRLEEALLSQPGITAARSRVRTRDRGVAVDLDLTVTPGANISEVTQESVRTVVDAIQLDLGLPLSGVPKVKIAFGGSKVTRPSIAAEQPHPLSRPSMGAVQTTDERISTAPPVNPFAQTTPPTSAPASADASPGPLIYDEKPPEPPKA
ncbi:MAG: hypothetical protein ABI559_00805 [Chloroflexota bacterium]